MKKIILTLILLISVISLRGQNMYDALNLSQNEYIGTARSMAVGNAVTAIGGDLGTIGINPAGSAVANYGQFVFSGSLTNTNIKSNFSVLANDVIDGSSTSKRTLCSIPSIAGSLVYNLGREKGLKAFSLAFLVTQTKRFDYYSSVSAINGITSKSAQLASAANGLNPDLLANYNSFYNTDINWEYLTAYQGGAISHISDINQYAAVTDNCVKDPLTNIVYSYLSGDLQQHSITNISGQKSDCVINIGANVSDQFFFGFNIGIPFSRYSYSESLIEQAINPDQFNVGFTVNNQDFKTNFKSASYNYRLVTDADGIYAKLGFIYTNNFLRIGAAFQTPTHYTIHEKWINSAKTIFTDREWNANQDSIQGDYTYNLITPFSFNLGVALTLGQMGFVSIDYERTDYSSMRFKNISEYYTIEDTFFKENECNRLFAGAVNHFRVGAEFRFAKYFAARAGYSTFNSPEKYYQKDNQTTYMYDFYDNFNDFYHTQSLGQKHSVKERTNIFSLGLGFASFGSFFCDLAASYTIYPQSKFTLYDGYTSYNSNGDRLNNPTPKISERRKLLNILLTLGFRF